MTRARNQIIDGLYSGKKVFRQGNAVFLSIGAADWLAISKSTVKEMELIDESSDVSVASAATRGFIGEMLFGPIGLAAAGTAKRDERYIVGIVFKDGQRSVLEVDGDLYRAINASVES